MEERYQEVFQRRKKISTYWFNKAADLHASAEVLWKAMQTPPDQKTGFSHAVACSPVYEMLCGMALELLFKAIIVAKGDQPQATHKLDVLVEEAGVNLEAKEIALLKILSEAIIWDGRYPVPRKEQQFQMLDELHWEHLFDRVPGLSIDIRQRNDKLGWESFNCLWGAGVDMYWATAKAPVI